MKTLAGILTAMAFMVTAHAEELRKIDAPSMSAEPAAQAPAATAAPASMGTVARAAITNGIEDREPVDNVARVTTETDKIYYFTELRDMEGQSVTHRWDRNGETMAEVEFAVGGPRWRVYSSKNLIPELTGEWRVSVVDGAGNTVRADTFMYTEAPEAGPGSDGMSTGTMSGAAGMKTQAPAGR